MPLTLRNLSKYNFKRKIKRKLFDILTSDDSYLDIRNIIQKVKFSYNFRIFVKYLMKTVSRVLEPLLRTQVDNANDSGSSVMEQLQAFFDRQGEEIGGTARGTHVNATSNTVFAKALSVSHLSL